MIEFLAIPIHNLHARFPARFGNFLESTTHGRMRLDNAIPPLNRDFQRFGEGHGRPGLEGYGWVETPGLAGEGGFHYQLEGGAVGCHGAGGGHHCFFAGHVAADAEGGDAFVGGSGEFVRLVRSSWCCGVGYFYSLESVDAAMSCWASNAAADVAADSLLVLE